LVANFLPNRDELSPPRPEAPAGRDVVLHTRVVTETGGGPDKTILLSHAFLKDSPYWLAAAYMHPPDDDGFQVIRARAAQYECPLIDVTDRGPLDRSVVRQMLELCRHYDVKIWHGHDYKSNLIGLLLRPFHNMKLVTTVHGWVRHTTRTPLYYAVDRLCLPHYDHVMCVSQDLHDRARKVGTPEDRCTLLRNAIDHEAFTRIYPAKQSPLRREMKTPDGRLIIGAVGRLSVEKNFTDLIRSVGQLANEGHDLELWIAGVGDQQSLLKELTDHLNLQDRVKLLGFRSDLIELYHAMDLFVLSSLREGLPNVVLEALAMEVPVVSTRVAEVPGVLTDGKTGLLCPVGDRDPLTDAIRTAVSDPSLRASLAQAGRQLIEREFTFARRMQRVRAIYDSVMQPAAQPVAAG